MQFFKDKANYYLMSIIAIVIRAFIVGVGFPEAIIVLGILSYEGYLKYLDTQKRRDNTKEMEDRLSSLESKFSLVNTRRVNG